jgi:hypothetical protein
MTWEIESWSEDKPTIQTQSTTYQKDASRIEATFAGNRT